MENEGQKCICRPGVGRHLIACPHTPKPDTERPRQIWSYREIREAHEAGKQLERFVNESAYDALEAEVQRWKGAYDIAHDQAMANGKERDMWKSCADLNGDRAAVLVEENASLKDEIAALRECIKNTYIERSNNRANEWIAEANCIRDKRKDQKMSGEIDPSEYPKHPGDNLTLDEMIEALEAPALCDEGYEGDGLDVIRLAQALRQCLKQRDDAMGDMPELKADYDAELMAMLRC